MRQEESTHMASEFWFFSQLHRLGYQTYITLGNAKSVDILVKLKNKTLTFDVKGKASGWQYPQVIPKDKLAELQQKTNHFFVFVLLNTKKDKQTGQTILLGEPDCFIVESKNFDKIASQVFYKNGAVTFGFDAKIFPYLKNRGAVAERSKRIAIASGSLAAFKKTHHLGEKINFDFYNKIVLTIPDFEKQYHLQK